MAVQIAVLRHFQAVRGEGGLNHSVARLQKIQMQTSLLVAALRNKASATIGGKLAAGGGTRLLPQALH